MQNRSSIKNSIHKLFSLILLTSVLSGAFSAAAAQTRRQAKTPATKTPEKKAPACNGGWSGTITYTQTLDESGSSDEPGIRKGKDRIIQEWSHNVSYNGKMRVDGSGAMPVAFGSVEFSDVRRQHGIEKVWDSCHAFNDEHWFIIDGKRDETEVGDGGGEAKNFNLNVNEFNGTYGFSFQFGDVKGKYDLEDHTKRSGHCQPQNNEPIDVTRKDGTTINGEAGRVEDQRIDPKNPNVLAGSVTIDRNDYSNPKRVKTPITVISWKFRRCSPPLVITDVKFYQPLYPSPSSWVEIDQNDHTVDGNQVKIVATVANLSGEKKITYVNFKELKENTDLPEAKIQVNFEPYQEREVEYIWDTSGYAWKAANIWNQPEIHREIEVKIPDDAMTKNIEVDPKPVVVVPGLWSNTGVIQRFIGAFQSIPTTEWRTSLAPVFINKTAAENAPVIDLAVRDLQKKENAWHVDLVAHSTGGLMARSYVQDQMPTMFDGRPAATHLVMIGTPNMGTPCASGLDNIFSRFFNRNAPSFTEVSIKNMKTFNQKVVSRNGTKFSILVGNAYAPICQMDVPGDGITPNRSAIWTIKDWKFSTSRARHEDLPGEQSNFMKIVNWLAVPPKGDHAPDTSAFVRDLPGENYAELKDEDFGKFRHYGAMFQIPKTQTSDAGDEDAEPDFSTGLKLAPNGSAEVEIPVTPGAKLALVFLAPPNVSAVLTDEKGEIVGKSTIGSMETEGTFRTITIKKTFQKGIWKLKFESREQTEAEIAVTAFIDYNSNIFAAQ
jgi:hypothetical protein